MEDNNPYAPPESELELATEAQAVWRDGKLLVMQKGAELPARCILCNAAADRTKTRRVFYLNTWLQVAMLVAFLLTRGLALLPILIVSLVFRKSAKIGIPLCAFHWRRRFWTTLTTLALLFAAIGVGLVAAVEADFQGALFFVALVIFVAAFALAMVRGQMLRAKKIDKTTVILKGAKPPFLDSLPQYPAP